MTSVMRHPLLDDQLRKDRIDGQEITVLNRLKGVMNAQQCP